MATATNIGNLFVTLNAQTLQYNNAMRDASRTTEVTMANIKKSVAFGTAAVVASFAVISAVSVQAFAEFESSFAGVKKTVDATEEEFEELSKTFRKMATEVPFAVTEINRVAEAAGQLGIAKEDIVDFTTIMLEMGISTDLASDQAAVAMARIATVTGLPIAQMDNLTNAIVGVGNSTAGTESEIVGLMLRLSGAASVVGMTEQEMIGLASAMVSVGINAEEGGTSLSKVMLEINTAVKGSTEELEGFARIAGQTVDEFSKGFAEDASQATIKFIEGLKAIKDAGGDVAGELESAGVSSSRMVISLLKLSGAGQLVAEKTALANKEWELNNARTKEVEERYKTFDSQVKKLLNRLNNIFITIGSKLVPVLKELLGMTEQNTTEFDKFNESVSEVGTSMANTMRFIVAAVQDGSNAFISIGEIIKLVALVIGESFEGVGKIINTLFLINARIITDYVNDIEKMFLVLKIAVLVILKNITQGTIDMIKPVIEHVNFLITNLNTLTGKDFKPISISIDNDLFNTRIANSTKALVKLAGAENEYAEKARQARNELIDYTINTNHWNEAQNEALAKLEDLNNDGSAMIKLYDELSKETKEVAKATEDVTLATTNLITQQQQLADVVANATTLAITTATEKSKDYIVITAKMREEAKLLKEAVKDPFEKGMDALSRYDALLKASLITQEEFNRATAEAFGTTTQELGIPEMGGAPKLPGGAFGGEALGGFALGGPEGDKLAEFQQEEQQLLQHMEKLEEIRLAGAQSMSDQQLQILDALHKQTGEKLAENVEAQNMLIFDSLQNTSDMMLGVLKETAGEQSGIYKVMFAASKAFAIAESIISIQQGMAKAISLGFPMGIFAAVQVAAQAAGIINTINSTVASFEGGGMTPSGPRIGGMDNKGGFMAMLHPDEKVVDLKGGASGGRGNEEFNLIVNIENTASDLVSTTATKSEDGKQLDILVKRTKKEIAQGVQKGGDEVSKAFENAYKVSRT